MMKIFESEIHKIKYLNHKKDFDSNLYNVMSIYYNIDPFGRTLSNNGGYQSNIDVDLIKQEWTHPLLSTVIDECINIIKREKVKYNFQLFVDELWININSRDDCNSIHSHAPDVQVSRAGYNIEFNPENYYPLFSFIYYLVKKENMGDLCFYKMNDYYHQLIYGNKRSKKIESKCGDLLIFPSNEFHSVLPNNTDELRISFSGNVRFKRIL